ncbi:helix-turn-helix domain-containing protein [Weissella minor]|uniref:helix-turn-helix domain-containing protein n=1 Tax=Weissella minor TaxID=1620 RepID=UPI003AF29EF7
MIKIHLDRVLLDRQISSKELTDKIGITPANLSILKTGKAKGIRFDMLNKLCEVLKCQPGDLMSFDNDAS